jgi:hypothetical protein
MICFVLLASLVTDVAGAAEAIAPIIDVGALLPAAESTVPVNGRLVFLGANDVSFVRVQVDENGQPSEEDLATAEVLQVDQFQVAHVVDVSGLALTVGEQLVVQSRCAQGCSFQGAWTVVDEDTTPPAFADGPARATAEHIDPAFGGTSGGYFITVELPGASDESGATMIELRGDIAHVAPQSFSAGGAMDLFVTTLDDSERTACFEAVAIDAAGNETTFRDELCVELVRPLLGGCAQTSASTSASLLGSLLALRIARRRGRRC